MVVQNGMGVLSSMPQIQISQTWAQIGIRHIPGQLQIEQPHPVVESESRPPELKIHRRGSQLLIDQTRAWEAYALISPVKLTQTIVSNIKAVYPHMVAKIAQDGDRMADVHLSTNVFTQLAREQPRPLTELKIAGPASTLNVEFEYQPEELALEVQAGNWQYRIKAQKPQITYQPGRVEIYLRQPPQLEIDWIIGRQVDLAV